MNERFLSSASLRVNHLSASAEQVVDIFGWTPKVAQTVREQRRTRSGKELPGRYSETFVLFPMDIEDHEFPEDFLSAYLAEPQSPDVPAIRRAVDAGCRVTFVFGISRPQSSGFDLDRKLIEAIRLTGASLSFFLYGSAQVRHTMNYYEQEIINALAAGRGNVVCAEGGADEVFTRVMERYPVHGSKIDWSRVEGSVEEQEWNLDRHSQSFERFFRDAVSRFGLGGEVVYVGDGLTDFALSGSIEGFEGLLGDIFEVPHHHYFLGGGLDWCICFSMEGSMSFGFSPGS